MLAGGCWLVIAGWQRVAVPLQSLGMAPGWRREVLEVEDLRRVLGVAGEAMSDLSLRFPMVWGHLTL